MRVTSVRLLTAAVIAAVIALGGGPALAATTGPGVVAGYMFSVTGAKFRGLTVTGTRLEGYSLLVSGFEGPVDTGHSVAFADPVSFFYLRLLDPRRHSGSADIPAEVTLTEPDPAEAPNVTVMAEYIIEEPAATVPLPASAWGLLAGIGALVSLRRRKRHEACAR